ncbi:MAG: Rne/Rng family ribonuclease [Hyphomicrobiaceae bacterium]
MDRNNKMLIDATHPEETRVVVLRNGRVEEFDFESAARKLLRGNIYLAKVTRVEPSLQAAFVDYGGNRHGFLAFSEIHPDYYQIPVADREALKQEQAEADAAEEAEAEERHQRRGRRDRGDRDRNDRGDRNRNRDRSRRHGADANGDGNGNSDAVARDEAGPGPDAAHQDMAVDTIGGGEGTQDARPHDDHRHDTAGESPHAVALGHDHVQHADDRLTAEPERTSGVASRDDERRDDDRGGSHITDVPEPIGNVEDQGVVEINGGSDSDTAGSEMEPVEQVATEEDALEELPERPRRRSRRQYKIQEVIKRRQIILIQIVKEERGNKGAALTTYISLAGRYTVLMPNTGRGGGISRKITQPGDRKRLKAIAEGLDVAEGMGLIIRTAGAARNMQEIKRDYEYLLRLWESVRDMTLSSTAPCLVYEEGNLIKRSIRDLYSNGVDGVVVAGEASHREARDFMTMLMPGHGDQVQHYTGAEPLFTRYGIERQLNALFSPYVNLRSGGYLVINQTEALVAIDVNSGKSTREFSIEETALNTNMEAAEEIARQLKLRDLAGLVVVDFIDMEEKRNNRSVERCMKDALQHDRARIQIGRISHFGLLEMSRQRLRTGMLEGSTSQCPHCQGTGTIRSVESVALAVLRGLEDNLLKQPSSLSAVTTAEVALYILNHKRAYINDMERRHGIVITVDASDRMQGANFAIERSAAVAAVAKPEARAAVSMDWAFDEDDTTVTEVDQAPRHDAALVAGDRDADSEHDDDAGHARPARPERSGRHDRHGRGERSGRGERHGTGERPRDDRARDDRARDERPGDERSDVVEVSDAAEPGEGDGSRSSRRRRRRRGRRGPDGGPERQTPHDGVHRNGRDGHSQHSGQHAHGAHRHEAGEAAGEAIDAERGVIEVGGDAPSPDARPASDWAMRDGAREEGVEEIGSDLRGDSTTRDDSPEATAGDDQGDRQRRGRRRGRRGGRGRGRDGQPLTRSDTTGAVIGAEGSAEGRDWGIAEIARPGADQPEGPPATVANSWDSGFVPTAPVPAPIPVRPPVERATVAALVDTAPPPTAVEPPVAAPLPPIPAPIPVREPVSLASRVPVIENRPPAAVDVPAPKPEPVARMVEPEPVAQSPVAPAQKPISETPAPMPAESPSGPARKGWWQRRFGGE